MSTDDNGVSFCARHAHHPSAAVRCGIEARGPPWLVAECHDAGRTTSLAAVSEKEPRQILNEIAQIGPLHATGNGIPIFCACI